MVGATGETPGGHLLDEVVRNDARQNPLIERGGQDPDWLTAGQLAGNPIRMSANEYCDWVATLPADFTDAVQVHRGPPRRVEVIGPPPAGR